MSKLPLWVYNYELKRHEVFPHHLLTQNPNGDGSIGLFINWGDREKLAALDKYRSYFEDMAVTSFIDQYGNYRMISTTVSPPNNSFYALKQRKEP